MAERKKVGKGKRKLGDGVKGGVAWGGGKTE